MKRQLKGLKEELRRRRGAAAAAASLAVLAPVGPPFFSLSGDDPTPPFNGQVDGGTPHTDAQAPPPGLLERGTDAPPGAATPEAIAGQAGIPAAVLAAYRQAATLINREDPGCNLSWTVIAGIGKVESNHAWEGAVDADGVTRSPILGPRLNGVGDVAAIFDTDGGVHDRDKVWDRAVGPMQFIPASWRAYGRDADGDGSANPHDVDDASLAAAAYLCAGERDLSDDSQLRSAIFGYNHSWDYVRIVLEWARAYSHGVTSVPNTVGSAGSSASWPGPGVGGTSSPQPGVGGVSPPSFQAGAPPPSGSSPAGTSPRGDTSSGGDTPGSTAPGGDPGDGSTGVPPAGGGGSNRGGSGGSGDGGGGGPAPGDPPSGDGGGGGSDGGSGGGSDGGDPIVGDTTPDTGTISGVVFAEGETGTRGVKDDGETVFSDAEVDVMITDRSDSTKIYDVTWSENGQFTSEALPPGAYDITVTEPGDPYVDDMNYLPDDTPVEPNSGGPDTIENIQVKAGDTLKDFRFTEQRKEEPAPGSTPTPGP